MTLEAGMTVTVNLDGKEHQFLLVHAGGDGVGKLSLGAPFAVLLGRMAVGDTLTWQASVAGAEKMKVELVKVEEGT